MFRLKAWEVHLVSFTRHSENNVSQLSFTWEGKWQVVLITWSGINQDLMLDCITTVISWNTCNMLMCQGMISWWSPCSAQQTLSDVQLEVIFIKWIQSQASFKMKFLQQLKMNVTSSETTKCFLCCFCLFVFLTDMPTWF